MDIGLFVVIMIVMYVVPEILKRLKPKKPFQYPEFPSTLPSEGQGSVGMPGELSQGVKPPPVPLMAGEGMPGDEGDPAWVRLVEPVALGNKEIGEDCGTGSWKMNEAVRGFVWAEIIAQPVALRPMRRGMRRL